MESGDQPLWNRVAIGDRSISVSVAISVLALALIAAAPFLTRPGLPHHTDTELHVYRAAELGHLLRAGCFYPRWAPDFYYGYGYPIFNYYAPLTYYLANLFDLLPGVNVVAGVKAVFVLGFFAASLGAYLLGRELFGRAAGIMAAASFVFAPYVVFIDPYARGVLAEHFAICLLPLVFYAFHRLMSGVGGRGALLGSVLSLAALVCSHNLIGPVAGGLLLAYWLWIVVFATGRRRAGWGGLAIALAVAVIAFFWLPVVLERDAIKLNVIGPGHFDFHEHFLALGELLAPSRVLDLGAVAPRYRFNLGLPQWVLALPALVVLLRAKAIAVERRWTLLYFALAGLGLIFLMLPVSTGIWERVPGMAYLQFPWRLLGPANLMLAVCAAAGTTLLPPGRWRSPVLASMCAAILLFALPVLYPPMWSPDFGPTERRDIIEWERRSLALGTTSTGDYLPAKAALVTMYPAPTLIESYARPGPVDRVNRASLPDDVKVEIVEQGPLHDRFAVSVPQGRKKIILRLFTFYFPGWRAYVDGERVEIEVAGPEGFITVPVPQGEHEVLVRFEDTPPRTAGWVISAAGLALLSVALLLMPPLETGAKAESGTGGAAETGTGDANAPPLTSSDPRTPIWLTGAVLLFVLFKSVIVDPRDDWMRYTSPPGQAWAAGHEIRANLGNQIELLGYDLLRQSQSVRAGEKFPVVLYWRALTPLDNNYQSFVHLARPLHILWGQEDHLNPAGLPTTRWPVDKYVWDEYRVRVLPGTPPGEYVLNVGLYWEGGRLQRLDENQQVVGDSVVLASVKVERPRRQPRLSELGMTHEVMVTFPEAGVTLLGYSEPYSQVTLPGAWRITFFWRADRDHPTALTRELVFLDSNGREAWRVSEPPVNGHYPFEVWQGGEIVRDPYLLAPAQQAGLSAGVYRFGVVLGGARGGDSFVPLGSVEFLTATAEAK